MNDELNRMNAEKNLLESSYLKNAKNLNIDVKLVNSAVLTQSVNTTQITSQASKQASEQTPALVPRSAKKVPKSLYDIYEVNVAQLIKQFENLDSK